MDVCEQLIDEIMPYQLDLTGFEAHIKQRDVYDRAVEALIHYCHVITSKPDATPGFLKLENTESALPELEKVAEHIKNQFSHVVIIGTGGSSLNPQSFLPISTENNLDICWLDAIDPTYIEATLRQIDLKKSCFIVISKSGGTTETITHTFLSKTLLEKEGITDLSKHFYVITDPQMSPLRRFAENHNIPVIDHDPDVGGRYAGLTAVGLLPALIAGLDAQKIIEGAYSTLEDISKIKGSEIVQSCALAYTLHTQGYQQAVLMVYQNALQPLSQWYRQMWAESLGKQGKGSTPITALGTVDQHSQLQLYLDGPRDKLFTLFLRNTSEQGALVNIDENLTKEFPQLEYLQGKTVGKIHHASGEATAMALRNQDLPVRLFRFDQLDEKLLGSLWMHIALETVLMAHLLEINAFDQPAVEEGKRLTRSLLTD